MSIYLPAYAWGSDFCFHTMPRCLMSPTRHALCMHTQRWPASWNQNLTPNHTDCWRGISASASLLVIFRGCGREIYFKAPVFVHTYTCNHTLVYDTCHTMHDNLTYMQKQLTPWPGVFLISYSVVLKDTQRKKCTIEWERLSELEAEKL